ncbi:MAG: DUF2085 domain-containing protein [Sandaracinus sp.]
MSTHRLPLVAAWLTLALGLGPLALVLLESIGAMAWPALARHAHEALGPLCHQMPERCPSLAGHALGACWRCLGVDLGLVVAGVLSLRGRAITVRAVAAALFVGLVDWLLGQWGASPDLAIERGLAGIALGVGLGGALVAASRTLGRSAPRLASLAGQRPRKSPSRSMRFDWIMSTPAPKSRS